MKKTFVSLGLAAAGAALLPVAHAQSVQSPAPQKFWNLSGHLRGFYDDNYAYSHNKQGSFGFEVSPSLSANVALQQTDIGVRYTYGMYYYAYRANHGMNAIDHTHQADLWLDHAFNQRWKANLSDSLVVAQDPTLVQGGAVTRVGGNNVANRAKATLNTDWTRQLSTSLHYGNNLFIYSNSHYANYDYGASQAALLNRMEQNIGLDLQWHLGPETMAFVGYDFKWVRYNGDGPIAAYNYILNNVPYTHIYTSSSRDYDSHYGYVGLQHKFTENLTGQVRGGAIATRNYNAWPTAYTSWAPYADLNVTYTYAPGSYAQLGFTQDINSTDIAQPGTDGRLTQYQQSSTVYGDINYQFTPKLTGSLNGRYQYSTFKNGAYQNDTGDSWVTAGCSLTYHINRHFSANTGYNFDELFSSIAGRAYSRNVVYIGLGAKY